jgi:thymidine kinase
LLVSKELYEDFKKELYHFRKRLLSMAKECTNPEMVCYAGFQLLMRSKPVRSDIGNCV